MKSFDSQVKSLSLEEKRLLLAQMREKSNQSKSFPLSFGQERLWLDSQLKIDIPLYNIAVTYHLKGVLNVTALEQSLQEIVKRHQSFRTTFSLVEGQPVQNIASNISFTLPILDLEDIPTNLRQDEAKKLASIEAKKTFNLHGGRLWCIKLFRSSEEEAVLLVVMHHIISDGWSFYVFCQELQQLYAAFSKQEPSPLPAPAIQYVDFIQKQRNWSLGEGKEKQLAYWQQQLGGNVQTVQLPINQPPVLISNKGTYQFFELSPSLSQSLKTLSKQENVTLFMTLMASFNVLLNCYAGQQDIVICSPVAGRHRSNTKELIGYCNNILPMRINLSGDPSFIELIRRVRQVALNAYKNQDLPIQEIINLPNLIKTSLTSVLFSLDMKWPPNLDLENIVSEPQPIHTETVNFNLTISLWEQEQEIRGAIEYKTDLFNDQMIAQMLKDYQALLETLVSDPTQSLSALPEYSLMQGDVSTSYAGTGEKTEYEAPRSVLEFQVAKICEEVLSISPIGVKDNLFLLGVSSLSVARLAERIVQIFDKELPLAAIFQSPTVEQLANLLRTNSSLPSSSLVAIQPKGSNPPLFLCEGVGIYSSLIPYLGSEQPIYGLMRELKESFDVTKVENIAKQYLTEIQKIQPKGPYFVGGLSFGGCVAFEIAQQFNSLGEEVSLVALFDTPAPGAYKLYSPFQRLYGHLINLFTYGWPYAKKRVDKILSKISSLSQKNSEHYQDSVIAISDSLIRGFYESNSKNYQFKVYPGRLTLFALNERKALTDSLFDPALGDVDPLLGWGELAAGGVEVYEVTGEHTTIFKELYVSVLGKKLKACLEKTQATKN